MPRPVLVMLQVRPIVCRLCKLTNISGYYGMKKYSLKNTYLVKTKNPLSKVSNSLIY